MDSKHTALAGMGLLALGLSACAPAQTGMGPMAAPAPAPVMMDHSREGGVHGDMGPMRRNNPNRTLGGPSVSPTGAITPGGTGGSRS